MVHHTCVIHGGWKFRGGQLLGNGGAPFPSCLTSTSAGCGVPEVLGIRARTPRSSWSLFARDPFAETAVTCSRDDTRRAYVLSRARHSAPPVGVDATVIRADLRKRGDGSPTFLSLNFFSLPVSFVRAYDDQALEE